MDITTWQAVKRARKSFRRQSFDKFLKIYLKSSISRKLSILNSSSYDKLFLKDDIF